MEEKLERIIQDLNKKGSTFDCATLKRVKQEVEQAIKKEQSIEECLKSLTKELEEASEVFLHDTREVISGISSCIYLPNPNGSYSITIYGGKTKYGTGGEEIDEKTIFDLASITKVYTLLLALKFIEKGFFKGTDKICELDSRFSNLGDYTVEDVLKMAGELHTEGRVAESKDKEQAFKVLKSAYVFDPNRLNNHYTDIGFIILSKVIEKLVSEEKGKFCPFEKIMEEYLLNPWGLSSTVFHPKGKGFQIAGNGNSEGIVHDPKTRLLGGAVGSAGLFSNVGDLKKLSDHLFAVENVNYTKLMGTVLYPTTKQNNKGYAGIYQKHPKGLEKTFVPNEYATGSFAHQGFTGAIAVFDPKNRIMNGILVNSIKEGEPRKPDGYMDAVTIYQMVVTEITMKAYLLNHYYQQIGYFENIELEGRAK